MVVHTLISRNATGGWAMNTAGETRVWPTIPAVLADYQKTMPFPLNNDACVY